MGRKHRLIGGGCLAALALGVGAPLAQQVDGPEQGGPLITFGISSTLSATDNYRLRVGGNDDAELFDTRLSFGYQNVRPIDALRFSLSGLARAIDPPGGTSSDFDDLNASLDYDRQGANSVFSFGTDYSKSSIAALNPFDLDLGEDPLGPGDLLLDDGDREQTGARVSFEVGVNDPIGFRFDASYRRLDYTGTTDPDLFDTDTLNLTGTTRFRFSPVTDGRLVLRQSDYEADDAIQTDRRTRSLSLGMEHQLSETDTLDVEIGVQRIETESIGPTTRSSGAIGSLSLTRELTNGTIATSFDLRETVNGQTATWRVTRALALPRGDLEFSFGVARDVADRVRPVGSIAYTHEMRSSVLTASIQRDIATTSLAEEIVSTRAGLSYDYEINSISNLGFTLNYVEVDSAGGPAINERARTDFRATYGHDLTPDWRLLSGYEYRDRDETGVGSATSNRIFLTLEREFTIRP